MNQPHDVKLAAAPVLSNPKHRDDAWMIEPTSDFRLDLELCHQVRILLALVRS